MAQKFASRGYVVSFPLRVASYDLVVDDTDRLWKIQVKQATWLGPTMKPKGRGDRERWTVALEYKAKKSGAAATRTRRPRLATEFDWLVVVCREDRIYVIPVDVLRSAERGEGTLLRGIHIKEEVGDDARADSKAAAARWLPYLNNFSIKGSVGAVTAEQPPAAELGAGGSDERELDGRASERGERSARASVTGSDANGDGRRGREARRGNSDGADRGRSDQGPGEVARPTKNQLQALVDGVLQKVAADPTREAARVVNSLKGSIVDSNHPDPREVERRRRAAQDRLRTHPEDASQDPADDDTAGF